jgi:hypothetical protein
MKRSHGLLALVLSAWLSGLLLAARPLGYESPLALRHPAGAPVPRFEPPPRFCEPLFVEAGCYLREDLAPEDEAELQRLLSERGEAVERWRSERRRAFLTAAWWRGAWPRFAAGWSVAAGLAALAVRRTARPS